MRVHFFIYALLFFSVLQAQQVPVEITDPDASFQQAIQLANDGDVSEAIQICNAILTQYQDYYDVTIYLAGLHGRESNFETAHALVEPLLKLEPVLQDAHLVSGRLYFWENDWGGLEQSARSSLELFPDQSELTYLLAMALYKQGQNDAALSRLESLQEDDPEYARAEALRKAIYGESDFPAVFTRYDFDYFTEPYTRSWHQFTAGLLYPLGRIKLSPSLSAGHAIDATSDFFSTTAAQVNLDGYITITETGYALLGYGFGTGTYLPRHRAIGHYWQGLSSGWTVSAGMRYFYFDQHFLFYALGIEKYLGDYWFDLKNYFFMKDYGLSVATYLTGRRYIGQRDHYIGLTVGYGTSPDEPITTLNDLQRLNALSTRISYNRQAGMRSTLGVGMGYMYEEYRENVFRNRFNGFISYTIKFP